MESESEKKNVTDGQMETLISYMEQHSLFARGQIPLLGARGHEKFKNMWSELTNYLNDIGPPYKDCDGWQKYWKAARLAAKEKKAKYIASINKTGNNEITPLSDFHHRISSIFGTAGVGLSVIPELGLQHKGSFHPTEETFIQKGNFNISNDESIMWHKKKIKLLKEIFSQIGYYLQTLSSTSILARKQFKLSVLQSKLLISLLEDKKDLAKDQLDEIRTREGWDYVAKHLSTVSTGKSEIQWQQVWKDQVQSVKKRKLDFLLNKITSLTEYDKSVLNLIDEEIPVGPRNMRQSEMSSPPSAKRLCTDQNKVLLLMQEQNKLQKEQNDILKTGFENIVQQLQLLVSHKSTDSQYLEEDTDFEQEFPAVDINNEATWPQEHLQ